MHDVRVLSALITSVMAIATLSVGGQTGADAARDGSSFQRAVIVNVAEPDRANWELAQILQQHPDMDLHRFSRRTVSHLGRRYDICELQSKAGKSVVMYFDFGADDVPTPNQALERTAARCPLTF